MAARTPGYARPEDRTEPVTGRGQEGASMNQPAQQQEVPGIQSRMDPLPDCGEKTYQGSGKLEGKAAVITGGDSGIGRAVAIAYAREGADVLISYLSEHGDAQETAGYVEEAGRKAVLVSGDVSDPQHCRDIIARAVEEFGRVDILVNNAAFQMTHETLEEIPDDEWDRTFATNISAMFHLCKAALPHMGEGSSIIGSSSVNSDSPSPTLAPYAATYLATTYGLQYVGYYLSAGALVSIAGLLATRETKDDAL